MKRIILITFTLIMSAILLAVPISATMPLDVGNTNDYGGSDWGGGSDWDSGSWDSGWDYDYSGDYYYDDESLDAPIFVIIIAIVLIVAILGSRNKRKNGTAGDNATIPTTVHKPLPFIKDNTQEIETVLKQTDPNFNSEKFLAWTREVFMTLQTAWTERDWSKIRPFEKEELFKQHELQLEEYKRLGRINIIERVNIKEVYLNRYVRDKDYEYLTVFIKARMGDYIIDEKSGELIKGNKDAEYELGYMIGFIRKNGIKTDINMSNHSTTNCPNCGAPTTVTSAGQCEYCDSVITSGEFDWVMYEYEGANQTNVNNTPVTIKE